MVSQRLKGPRGFQRNCCRTLVHIFWCFLLFGQGAVGQANFAGIRRFSDARIEPVSRAMTSFSFSSFSISWHFSVSITCARPKCRFVPRAWTMRARPWFLWHVLLEFCLLPSPTNQKTPSGLAAKLLVQRNEVQRLNRLVDPFSHREKPTPIAPGKPL